MTERVNSKRSYHSPRRVEQAAATRAHILRTARRTLESEGYANTSVAAIAAAAEVSSKTLYLAFSTKSGLLRALWDVALGGADDQRPVTAREWYREMADERDAERRLRINARNSRTVKERAGGMLRVISDAAQVDHDARELWQLIQTEFHDNQATVVQLLHDQGALRPEVDVDRAADILWTINHPDLWRLLVVDRGWSTEAYEIWTADTACAQLLVAAPR
jgi:AcrR family transcriptional regulator